MSKRDRTAIQDPSVQRLIEHCTKDINQYYRSFHDKEKIAVKKVMTDQRLRYCTFVANFKPVIDEEFGMLGELNQIEEVMYKLARATASPDILPEVNDQLIEDGKIADFESGGGSLVFATPPSTPSPSMGSRKSSMCSISSFASTAAAGSRASSAMSMVISDASQASPSRSEQFSINGDMASHESMDFSSLDAVTMASIGSGNICNSRPGSAASSQQVMHESKRSNF